jgi:hypothetical protein
MKLRKPAVLIAVAIFAATACSPVSAQEKRIDPTKESCLAFVQQFYRWYVPKARDVNVASLDVALRERRSAFDARLIKGVDDVEADAERNREAGLDFDWILNTQDPGDPGDPDYVIRNSRVTGNVCRVDVSRSDAKSKKIVPELEFRHGRWVFVNFHYPDSQYPQSENLLSIIKGYLHPINNSSGKR